MSDPRADRLAKVYEINATYCEQVGHEFIPDAILNDYSCGYCRMVRAMYPVREGLDKTREPRT